MTKASDETRQQHPQPGDMAAREDALFGERQLGSGRPFISWMVILVVTAGILATQMVRPVPKSTGGRLRHALFELQAKYLVGTAILLGDESSDTVRQQIEQWQPSQDWQQIRAATVAGELSSPDDALIRLREIVQKPPSEVARTDDGSTIRNILIRLYQDYAQDQLAAPSVTEAERNRLRAELGWFGKLALAPAGKDHQLRRRVLETARQTVFAVIGGVVAIGVIALLGVLVLFIFGALLLTGSLTHFSPSSGRGNIYVEAFACWLILFCALNLLGGLWFGSEGVISTSLLSLAGSMLALSWPLFRGVSWQQIRCDVGWTKGHGLIRESAGGIGCYAMGLCLAILASLVTSLLLVLVDLETDSGWAPVHPAAEWLADASPWQRVQLILLACVVAPLVEETVFRGLLYRHLREATGVMRKGSGVVVSAGISAVLFAFLHPQGLLTIPSIVGIAIALAFMREWRDTLIPSVLGHGLNNIVTVFVLISLLDS